MTWGVDNSAIPHRSKNDVLRDIRFHPEMDEQHNPTGRVAGYFRHRDGRIWSVLISPLVADASRRIFPEAAFSMSLTSAGCRQYNFISRRLPAAKRTVLRFANMAEAAYEQLVADATGTQDHPRSGEIAIFRAYIIRRRAGYGRVGYASRQAGAWVQEPIEGIGRYEGGKLILFPQSDELEDILDPVCSEDTRVMVPAGLNALPRNALIDRINVTTALQDLDARVIDTDCLYDVVGEHFNDTAAEALAGLADGSYSVREARSIEFYDEQPDTDG